MRDKDYDALNLYLRKKDVLRFISFKSDIIKYCNLLPGDTVLVSFLGLKWLYWEYEAQENRIIKKDTIMKFIFKKIEMLKKTLLIISKLILFFLLLFSLNSCCTTKSLGVKQEMYQGYIPIEPSPVKLVNSYDSSLKTFTSKPWASLDDSTKRSFLPIQSAQIALRKVEHSGELSYLAASVSNEMGSYEVIMDYMKYRIENVIIDSTFIGNGRVGIGLRIKASVKTSKTDLNLSSLTSLGVEASKNNLKGFLSVDVVGVDSKDVTNHLPLTAKLDETSIMNALQAIATIKSKIWNNDIQITPHLIAINQKKNGTESVIIEKVTNVSTFSFTASTKKILSFLKPIGNKYSPEKKAIIIEWMESNNLDSSPGKFTIFIYAKENEANRQKAINDLKL